MIERNLLLRILRIVGLVIVWLLIARKRLAIVLRWNLLSHLLGHLLLGHWLRLVVLLLVLLVLMMLLLMMLRVLLVLVLVLVLTLVLELLLLKTWILILQLLELMWRHLRLR